MSITIHLFLLVVDAHLMCPNSFRMVLVACFICNGSSWHYRSCVKKVLDTAAHAFDMAVAYAAVSSATKYDFGAWSSRQSLVNAGRQQRIWQGEYALLPGRAAECFRGLVLDLRLDKKESQAGRWRVGRKSQIVAASPPAEELAVRTEPLTKQDLVAYLASGCKPKEKWRSAFLSPLRTSPHFPVLTGNLFGSL